MKKVVGGVLAAALVVASGCSTTKQGYVSKGNKFFAENRFDDAALNYRKAIQKDPRYGEAYYRLGLTALKQDQAMEGYSALEHAVELQPNNIEAKEKLGELILAEYMADSRHPQNLYRELFDLSSQILAKNPNSFEGLRERGYLAYTDRKPEEAIALFRQALKVEPEDGTLTTALVQVLMASGHPEEAEQLGLNLIARQKTYGPMYHLMYTWYVEQKRMTEAENLLVSEVANNPTRGEYILRLAGHYSYRDKPKEMEATLDKLLNDPKDFPQARLWVGDFYMGLQKYPEAIRYYQDGVNSSSSDDDKVLYQKKITNVLLKQGQRAEAAKIVEQILTEKPKDGEALRMQATLWLDTGEPQNVDAAGRQFQTLAAEKPDDAFTWLGLGTADELKGNLDAARARYLEAIKKRKDYLPARYALAEISLVRQQPNDALQQANEILLIKPHDLRARLLRALSLIATGNPALARSELTALIAEYPNDAEPQIQLAILALAQKKYAESEQLLEKLRGSSDPRVTAARASLYAAQKQFDKATGLLDEALAKSPNSIVLRSRLADIDALSGHFDRAIAEYRRLLTQNEKAQVYWLRLGEVYQITGDFNNAITVYRQAQALSPKDLDAGLALAGALGKGGRTAEAKAEYQNLLKQHPDSSVVMNDYAFFISQSGGDLDEALRFAQKALEASPGQPGFSDTIGCIYLKKGLRDSAIRTFNTLVQKYPAYSIFHYHLGMAMLDKGDKKAARKELQTALSNHPTRQDEAKIKELLSKIG